MRVYQNVTDKEIQIQTIGRQFVKLGPFKKISLRDHEDAFVAPLVNQGILQFVINESVPDFAEALMKMIDEKFQAQVDTIVERIVGKLLMSNKPAPIVEAIVSKIAPVVVAPIKEEAAKIVEASAEASIEVDNIEPIVDNETAPVVSERSSFKGGNKGKRH